MSSVDQEKRLTSLLDVDWSTLPKPRDDGAARHLRGARMPSVPLKGTDDRDHDLSRLSGLTVIFVYPLTGRPDRDLPEGWDDIPGARGCTPQACSIRDSHSELMDAGVRQIFGLSTQDTTYQQEAAERLHLPYPLLSDAGLELATALQLPVMTVDSMTLLKRLTLIIRDSTIAHVLYPVFPPDQAVKAVLTWLGEKRQSAKA